jgi:amidohydrolase
MLDDGFLDRFGVPEVVLGQHVAPMPAGWVGAHPGPAFASADTLRVRMFGRGGHGSRPETTVDPVGMAAATVLRLQTVVSREVGSADNAVVTVGSLHAGTTENTIPNDAELGLTLRSYTAPVRERILAAVARIVRAEAAASGAPQEPEITSIGSSPLLANDAEATERTMAAFRAEFGADQVVDPGAVSACEDVGTFAVEAGSPLCYWLLGGADPAAVQTAGEGAVPYNHSSKFAPVIEPTLTTGIRALVTAARTWLPQEG